MKLKSLLASLTLCLVTASSSYAQMMPGSDSDKHGCKASAGYTWSQIQKECVRMWEAGIKLTAINSAETNAAYLIFSTDKKKVEVFVANNGTKEQSIVLKKKKNKYCNKTFTLLTEKGYILLKDNKEIYKSE